MGKEAWMNMAHTGSNMQLAGLEGGCSGVVQHVTAPSTIFCCQYFSPFTVTCGKP